VRTAILALLLATAAAADEPRFDFRLGISAGWLLRFDLAGPYSLEKTGGVATLEAGVGFRATEHLALGVFGRIGLLHYAGGVEVTAAPWGWSRDGLVLRVGASAMRDAFTCNFFDDDSSSRCNSATYFLAEAGPQYRWASGVSLGFAVLLGRQRVDGSHGPATQFAWGVLGPRVQGEF
jgi:hypothetical protein